MCSWEEGEGEGELQRSIDPRNSNDQFQQPSLLLLRRHRYRRDHSAIDVPIDFPHRRRAGIIQIPRALRGRRAVSIRAAGVFGGVLAAEGCRLFVARHCDGRGRVAGRICGGIEGGGGVMGAFNGGGWLLYYFYSCHIAVTLGGGYTWLGGLEGGREGQNMG